MPEEFFTEKEWNVTLSRLKRMGNRTVNLHYDARYFASELEKAYKFLDHILERVEALENE